MVIDGKNGIRLLSDKLIVLMEDQNNEEVISMLENVPVHRLTGSDDSTLLHYSAMSGNPVITQYLIDRGCKVNDADSSGNTPLIFAVGFKCVDTINALLLANAEIGKICHPDNGDFLLHSMVNRDLTDIEIIESVFAKITSECFNNNDIARKLVELECPLPGVIFLKDAELTKLMLNLGCSVDERLSDSNETALHLAVEFSDVDNVKVLLDHGADVNVTDSKDCTPLHRFQLDHDRDILRLLLEQGASVVTTENPRERSLISWVLSVGDSRTIDVLLPYIDLSRIYANRIYPLHELTKNKNDDIVEVLRGKKFDVNARDYNGYTPLDKAADRNHVRMVQFLLENGADPNNIDEEGDSTLHFIMSESIGQPEKTRKIIELLLHYGANAQFVWGDVSPVFDANSEVKFDVVQPVLAHLAMIESFGESLHNCVREEMEASLLYKNYFEKCRMQIELMKNIVTYESVTLYSLLSAKQEEIAMFSRNQEFLSSYELFVKNNQCDIDSYYIKTIRFRVDKTLNLVQTKEKVACILCKMLTLPHSMLDVIGYNVLKYLQPEDLENVLQM